KEEGKSYSHLFDNTDVHLIEKVAELRNDVQVLAQRIHEISQQDNARADRTDNNTAATESLNRRYDTIFEEVMELRQTIGAIIQQINEVSQQDNVRTDIITAAVESFNRRYNAIFDEVMELRNVLNLITRQINENMEKNSANELVLSTTESLNKRCDR